MSQNWQLEPRRCLALHISWNLLHKKRTSWWWWAPSSHPNTKLWLLEIRGWIQKAKKKLKSHLSKRETRTSLQRSHKVPRRITRRRRKKWASAHTAIRTITLKALVWKSKLICWPNSWRRMVSPFHKAQRRENEDQVQMTERDFMHWLLAHQAHPVLSLILELQDTWFRPRRPSPHLTCWKDHL